MRTAGRWIRRLGLLATMLVAIGAGLLLIRPSRLAQDPPLHLEAARIAVPATLAGGPCRNNGSGQLVVVSIRQQHAWMCQNAEQVYSTPVTTGAVRAGDATPVGSWRVQGKETSRYLAGPGYVDFVRYWIPINGDYGLHDAAWQTIPFGSPQYVERGSHGCIHVPIDAMRWLYSWLAVGSRVTVEA